VLFAAIFKVLPDTVIAWRDVIIGAFVTAVLFTIGKSLIGWYLGTTAASSGYGAAGALILILLWSYYSAQILLFGAELTRAMAPPQPDDKQGKTSESERSSPSLQPDGTAEILE
jgi:membrane protein